MVERNDSLEVWNLPLWQYGRQFAQVHWYCYWTALRERKVILNMQGELRFFGILLVGSRYHQAETFFVDLSVESMTLKRQLAEQTPETPAREMQSIASTSWWLSPSRWHVRMMRFSWMSEGLWRVGQRKDSELPLRKIPYVPTHFRCFGRLVVARHLPRAMPKLPLWDFSLTIKQKWKG